ncbi:MAG: hypothetical protein COA82_13350 [Alkaliphilus sp.]|nr:hypothetical protein [bacterium AH-315-L21]PHS28841.1 MAG: hypothetical protein COA82_13350 [Alkaliphilus sp.]
MSSRNLKIGAFQFAPIEDTYKNVETIKRGIELAANDNVRLLFTQECANSLKGEQLCLKK